MPYLVDGHNVIGTGLLPGISLADEDDEIKLVHLLRRYYARVRTPITVVFDQGLPGGRSASLSGGGVEVIFASALGQDADAVLISRIRRARHPSVLRVVTSDRRVQAVARAHGCRVISAQAFAHELSAPLPEPSPKEDVRLSEEEIEGWLRLFRTRRRGEEGQGKDR